MVDDGLSHMTLNLAANEDVKDVIVRNMPQKNVLAKNSHMNALNAYTMKCMAQRTSITTIITASVGVQGSGPSCFLEGVIFDFLNNANE